MGLLDMFFNKSKNNTIEDENITDDLIEGGWIIEDGWYKFITFEDNKIIFEQSCSVIETNPCKVEVKINGNDSSTTWTIQYINNYLNTNKIPQIPDDLTDFIKNGFVDDDGNIYYNDTPITTPNTTLNIQPQNSKWIDENEWYKFITSEGTPIFEISNTCLESYPCKHMVKINGNSQNDLWDGLTINNYLTSKNIAIPKHLEYLIKSDNKSEKEHEPEKEDEPEKEEIPEEIPEMKIEILETFPNGNWVYYDDNLGNLSSGWYKFINNNRKTLFEMSGFCRHSNPCQHNVKLNGNIRNEPGLWNGLRIHQYLTTNNIPIPSHFDYLKTRINKDMLYGIITKDDLDKVLQLNVNESIMKNYETFKIALLNNNINIINYFMDRHQRLHDYDWVDICHKISLNNFQKLVNIGMNINANHGTDTIISNSLKNKDLFFYLINESKINLQTDNNQSKSTNVISIDPSKLISMAISNKASSDIIDAIINKSKELGVKYNQDAFYQSIQNGQWDLLQKIIECSLVDNEEFFVQKILYKLKSKPFTGIVKMIKAKYPMYANI